MKHLLLILMMFAITAMATAQDSSFHLKHYKYRTEGFRALALSFGLNGSTYHQKNPDDNQYTASNFHLNPSHVYYNRFRSTDNKWHQMSISAVAGFSTSKSSANDKEAKTTSGNGSIHWSLTERYFRSSQWFLELSPGVFASTSGNRHTDTLQNNKNGKPQLGSSLGLGFGKGRIEAVQDAQMALFIIQDLQHQGLLQRTPDAQTTLELARLITDINNRRIFDIRRRRIYELTRIDSFLRTSGLVESADIRVFTTINDNWALAFNPQRFAGTSWYVRLQPSASWLRAHATNRLGNGKTESTRTNKSFNLMPVLGIEKYIPVNLHWQRNMGASFSWNRRHINILEKFSSSGGSSELENTINRQEWNANLYYNIGYFPNNRTLIYTGAELLATHIRPDLPHSSLKSETHIKPGLHLSADYFISYNTRLSANANASYLNMLYSTKNEETAKERRWQGGFSLTINHIIF